MTALTAVVAAVAATVTATGLATVVAALTAGVAAVTGWKLYPYLHTFFAVPSWIE